MMAMNRSHIGDLNLHILLYDLQWRKTEEKKQMRKEEKQR